MSVLKLYFSEDNDEICYPLSYFKWLMDYDQLSELVLFEAQKQEGMEDYFWCRGYDSHGTIADKECGNKCELYCPRNKKSGCCSLYSQTFYEPTEKKLILKK